MTEETKDNEVIKTVDYEGNEFTQRAFDVNEVPKKKPRRKNARTVKVISITGAKLFLSDGYIMPHEEKDILLTDYKMPGIGSKVRKLA